MLFKIYGIHVTSWVVVTLLVITLATSLSNVAFEKKLISTIKYWTVIFKNFLQILLLILEFTCILNFYDKIFFDRTCFIFFVVHRFITYDKNLFHIYFIIDIQGTYNSCNFLWDNEGYLFSVRFKNINIINNRSNME